MFIDLFSYVSIASIRMEGAGVGLVMCLFAVLAVLSILWHHKRGSEVLEQWANRSGYKLIASEYRNFAKGPFFWRCSKGQAVYYVTVLDQCGKIRSGWVRCGGWASGLFSNEATVKWDL